MTHHHGSPIWNRTGAPASFISATNPAAAVRSHAIAALLAGESKADGGSHAVRAAVPSLARCCQPSGQCWASNS